MTKKCCIYYMPKEIGKGCSCVWKLSEYYKELFEKEETDE